MGTTQGKELFLPLQVAQGRLDLGAVTPFRRDPSCFRDVGDLAFGFARFRRGFPRFFQPRLGQHRLELHNSQRTLLRFHFGNDAGTEKAIRACRPFARLRQVVLDRRRTPRIES